MKIACIFQGRLRNIEKVFREVRQAMGPSHEVSSFITKSPGHAFALAEQAVGEGFTHIISAGGDGTLNEVANGMMASRSKLTDQQWSNLRLGILPLGSGNDFARVLGVNGSIKELNLHTTNDAYREVDLGLVDYYGLNGRKQSRYFINITDVGMGGVVAEKVNQYPKWFGGKVNYQRAILSTFLKYRHKPIIAKADQFSYEGDIIGFIIANGKYFGNAIGIAPDAEVDDGMFSVVILGNISLPDYARHLNDLKKCRRIEHDQLHYYSAKKIELNSPAGPAAIDMDGEFIGYTPMEVTIVPKALKVLAPGNE